MKTKFLLLQVVGLWILHVFSVNAQTYEGNVVTSEGAWCWFADPRALHYENESGTINSTYIGYIDVHGNIKATQHNFLTNKTSEVLIRSYFQPDDHDNPTFLVLPDERIMIFYSRHTDEACFYYRVSRNPGDITSLGAEKKLVTANNTTYPSPFILSNDPQHIYLCWRGINWHPTIARLTLPDANDNVSFDWGPKQIVQSTGARPYAKYVSNGVDKIYLTYTTGHPDNENPNWIYFNYINISGTDATKIKLTDVNGKELSMINNSVHNVNKTEAYRTDNPFAVVENTAFRNWVWQVSMDPDGRPVIAMVRINDAKTSHDYYYAKWTGSEWQKTFLENGGGHFHQTAGLELCYSGGMAIDDKHPDIIYCSVPVTGSYGKVYEIKKYTIGTDGKVVSTEQITKNSKKGNARPYIIPNSGNSPLRLVWMNGDYYDWIVSSSRPQGYPTAIHADFEFPADAVDLENGLLDHEDFDGSIEGTAHTEKGLLVTAKNTSAVISAGSASEFTVSLAPYISGDAYDGQILKTGNLIYGLATTKKPYIQLGTATYESTNVLGNSDVWQTKDRGTGGQWYEPTKLKFFSLTLTYGNGLLTSYINGLIDQVIEVEGFSLSDIEIGGFAGWVQNCYVYNRVLSQGEIKQLSFLLGLEELTVPQQVYTDIVLLPATSSGKAVTWTSSAPEILSNTGLVTLPQTPVTVTLTATMDDNSKQFTTTVMPRNIENNKLLEYTFEAEDVFTDKGVKYVSDKSGKGNPAAIYGNAQVNGQLDLKANTAAGFSTNGYAMVPNGIIDNLRSYSFVLKVTPASLTKQPRLYDFGSGSGNSVFGRADKLTAGLKYNGGTTKMLDSPTSLTVGKETFLAFTFDAKTQITKIYVDKVEKASGTVITNEPYQLSQLASNTRNYIGRTQWWDSSVAADNIDYNGTIDDFYLFDIALTANEIVALQSKTGLEDIRKANASSLQIYPNPATGNEKIYVALSAYNDQCISKVEVFNLLGQLVQTQVQNANPVVLDGMNQNGMYIIRLTDTIGNTLTGKCMAK